MSGGSASDSPTRARERLRRIIDGGLMCGHAGRAVRRHLELESGGTIRAGDASVSAPGHVLLLAVGKAAPEMAAAARERLGDRIDGGLVIAPAERAADTPAGLEGIAGDHPVAGERSLRAGARARQLAESLSGGDLLVCLLSGGASALMEDPADGVELAEIARVTRKALRTGMSISDLNRERGRRSTLKAGGLARMAAPAEVIGLVLSDVVGDAIDTIGSGPTALEADHVRNVLVGSNELLLQGATEVAGDLGYEVHSLGRTWQGEAREIGALLGRLGAELSDRSFPLCLVAAGESTVTVTGQGRGGRNQEATLAAARALDGVSGVWFASAGSDGRDGPTPVAGAIADGRSLARARAAGLDPGALLDDNDSWTFFDTLGDHLITGPTGTNLMDLQILLVGSSS